MRRRLLVLAAALLSACGGDGELWIAYHAWPSSGDDECELWLDRLTWVEERPMVKGPPCRPQPVP